METAQPGHAPLPLQADRLEVLLPGRRIYCFAECASTSLFARGLVEGRHGDSRAAAPEGCLVAADHQSAGRGRKGNRWQARAGSSLLFTLTRETPVAPAPALAAAVAVHRALARLGLTGAGIKWPNDLLDAAGRKLCGILAETARRPDGAECLLLGVGLNVSQRGEDFSPELREHAASLAMCMPRPPARETLLAALLPEIEHCLTPRNWRQTLDDWRRHSTTLGRALRLRLEGGARVFGQALGIEDDGRLLLRLENGAIEAFSAGEVEELRPDTGPGAS